MRNPLSVFRDRVATPIMEGLIGLNPRFVRVTNPHACCTDCGVSASRSLMIVTSYGYMCSACALLSVKVDRTDSRDIQLPGTKGAGTGLLIQGDKGEERITWYVPPHGFVFERFVPSDVQIIRTPGVKQSIKEDFIRQTLPMVVEAKGRDPGEPFCWAWLSMNNCHKAQLALRKWSLDDDVWLAFFQDGKQTEVVRLNAEEWRVVFDVMLEQEKPEPAFTASTIVDYHRLSAHDEPSAFAGGAGPMTDAEHKKWKRRLEQKAAKRLDMEDQFPWLKDIAPAHMDALLSQVSLLRKTFRQAA